MMSKTLTRAAMAVSAVALCLGLAACAPSTPTAATGAADSGANTAYSEQSLIAFHDSLGQDISGLTEISVETCGSCHGDLAEIQADTEDVLVYEGHVGNPHKNHMTKEFECTDCHNLTDASQLGCNETCHQWELSRDNGTWAL